MDNTGSCADLYDLHLHTYWSYDATANPENYFRRAREIGVRCLAIADHHVLDSLEEVMEIAQDYKDIKVINCHHICRISRSVMLRVPARAFRRTAGASTHIP